MPDAKRWVYYAGKFTKGWAQSLEDGEGIFAKIDLTQLKISISKKLKAGRVNLKAAILAFVNRMSIQADSYSLTAFIKVEKWNRRLNEYNRHPQKKR